MIYKHIFIQNFIPMMGLGTKSIDVDIVSNTLIIIGTNGCGKSSLLKELTPYPANRPDYLKNGIKQLTLEHNGSTYILTSDFSKPTKAHSFQKDGEELNESGANIAQYDLCKEHFGLTEIISSLINLEYHICSMGRAERKNLFMLTYPRSMGFILDYHKRVCYQIRDFNVNIKNYKERKLILEEKILSLEERNRLSSLLSQYQKLNNTLDQQIYAANQKISMLKDSSDYVVYKDGFAADESTKDPLVFLKHLDHVISHNLHCLAKIRRKHPEWKFLFEGDEDKKRLDYYNIGMQLTTADTDICEYTAQCKELKEQLEQYEQAQGIDVEKEIRTSTERIAFLEDEKNKAQSIVGNKLFPVVSSSESLYQLNQNEISKIRYLLSEIFQSTTIWVPDDVAKAKQQIWAYQMELNQHEKQLNFYKNQLKELTERGTIVKNIDPECRSSICHLKEMVENKVKETKAQIDRVRDAGRNTKKRYDDTFKLKEYLDKEIQEPLSVNDYVIQLIELLMKINLADFVCDGKWDVRNFIKILNENGTKIWDKLGEFITLNEVYLKIKSLSTELTTVKDHLETMKKIHVPAQNLIVKTISEKQLLLKKYIDWLDDAKRTLKSAQEIRELQNELYGIPGIAPEIDYCLKEVVAFKKWYEIDVQIKSLEDIVTKFTNGKNVLQCSLNELETTLKEQNGYLTRLNDEILPNLHNLELECMKWTSLEQGLNPINGIPKQYMVKYLNGLIDLVNKIIKCVWVYDMEILPLDENGDDLDYNFSFVINGSDPIKDISLASTGQQEMIDLAWVLAIYHQMQLGKKYPLKLDEPDGGLINEHRTRLLLFLSDMMRNEDLKQLFMVNHFANVYDTFMNSQTLCIKEEGIILPSEYNQSVTIENV